MKDVEKEVHWDRESITGVKVGMIDNKVIKVVYRKEDMEILSLVEEELNEAGAITSKIIVDEEAFNLDYLNVLKHEFSLGIQSYFESYGEIIKDIQKDMIFICSYTDSVYIDRISNRNDSNLFFLSLFQHTV